MCSKSWVLATYILQKNPRRYMLHLFLAAERGSPSEAVQHFFMKLFAVEYSNIHREFWHGTVGVSKTYMGVS